MKVLIIYYSMTGNTQKIAHSIRKGIRDYGDECDIVAIKGTQGVPGMKLGHVSEYDLIGIAAGVWRGSPPPNMMDFINTLPSRPVKRVPTKSIYEERTLPMEDRQQCFFFLTHSKFPGPAIANAYKALDKRGLAVIGWGNCYGEAKMSYMHIPWQTAGHPDEIDQKEAEEFGREMVIRSRKISAGETNLFPSLPSEKEYLELYAIPTGGEPKDGKEYPSWVKHDYGVKIDWNKCVRCGLCEAHCPKGAIDLDAENPILPNCIWCTTCEMVCPVAAIDLNMEALKADRGRTPEEIKEKAQELETWFVESQKALRPEKRLRRLIPPEDLWKDGYVYDLPDHPRVVIAERGWRQRNK